MAITSQSKTFHTLGILGVIFGIIMAVIALLTIVTEVGVDLGDNDLEKAAVLIKMTTMGVNGVLLAHADLMRIDVDHDASDGDDVESASRVRHETPSASLSHVPATAHPALWHSTCQEFVRT